MPSLKAKEGEGGQVNEIATAYDANSYAISKAMESLQIQGPGLETLRLDLFPNAETKYNILSVDTVFETIIELVKKIQSVLVGLSTTNVLILLNYMKWKEDKLFDAYFQNEERILEEIKIWTLANKYKIQDNDSIPDLCSKNCPESSLYHLSSCGHGCCKKCWGRYLQSQINAGVGLCVSCPESECSDVLEHEFLIDLLRGFKTILRQYKKLIVTSYVTTRKSMRWCPKEGCGRIVSIDTPNQLLIWCSCGSMFCFNCGEDWHEPLSCKLLSGWLKKFKDDIDTMDWMLVNTKDCPQCGVVFEKIEGCNEIQCPMDTCKFNFCYICLEETAAYQSYHYRGRCREAFLNKRCALDRYVDVKFSYMIEVYFGQKKDLQLLEFALVASAKTKMHKFQVKGILSADLHFIGKAAQTILECKRVLMFAKMLCFKLDEVNQTNIFDFHFEGLANATEMLQWKYLKGVDKEVLNNEDIVEAKCEIQDLTASCKKRKNVLLKVLDGEGQGNWTF